MAHTMEDQIKQIEDQIENDTELIRVEEEKLEEKERKNKTRSSVGFWGAVILVILGLGIAIHGIVEATDPYIPLSLNELGDYLGGSVASLWSLAGVLFIYVSFLGQQTELGYTRLEQKRSRLQLLFNQKEVATQKYLVDQQVHEMKMEGIRNEITQLIDQVDKEIDSFEYTNNQGEKALNSWLGLNKAGTSSDGIYHFPYGRLKTISRPMDAAISVLEYIIERDETHLHFLPLIKAKWSQLFKELLNSYLQNRNDSSNYIMTFLEENDFFKR